MPDKIRLLPDNIASQIAAGEVVTEPASVVKEMVENAVDAGAGNVTVNFRDGGRELIQIIDDGEGMSPVDARLAFDKHATSKIRTVEDIYKLHTFGFRGEALASIAAVAHVELSTRRQEDEVGVKITIEGSRFVDQQVTTCGKGCNFQVRNIFYNLPARRRMLDKNTVSSRHITTEFQRVALCHPEVAFSLYNEDAPVYSLPASTLKGRIVGLMGKGIASNLLETATDTTIVGIEGFVGRPQAAKKSNSEQYLFVNGRFFKSAYIHKAVLQAYEKLIPVGLQPSYFLYLKVDPENVDVNMHPQKTEVKFSEGPAIWQIVNAAVREALAKTGAVPMMDFDDEREVDIPAYRPSALNNIHEPSSTFNPDYNPFAIDSSNIGRRSVASMNDFVEPYARSENDRQRFDGTVLDYINGVDRQAEMELGQYDEFKGNVPLRGGYVATSSCGELVLVDMSRAREAMLFKRYMAIMSGGDSVSQSLMFPERMVFSCDDVAVMRDERDEFACFGFEYTIVDDNTVDITAVPAEIEIDELSDVMYDMLDSVRDRTADAAELRCRRIASTLAHHGRVAITPTEGELTAILESLDVAHGNSFTPDGRPVIVRVGVDEMKKMFLK